MGVGAWLEARKVAVAMLLALGGDGAEALSVIGFHRLPYLAPAPSAMAAAAEAVPASIPM